MNKFTWLSILVLGAALVGCPGGSSEPEGEGGEGSGTEGDQQQAGGEEGDSVPPTLTVYSGRSEELIGPVITAFEQQLGVEVRVNFAGSQELAATILEEGARSPADVFISQDASTLGLLEEQGVFATIPSEITARAIPAFRSPTNGWVGTSGRARVLAYSTANVTADQLPTDVQALTQPEWRGRVGWAPENASFQSFIAAMIETQGEEATEAWVTAMAANEPQAYPSNTPMVQALGRGEIHVGLTNHYYLYRIRAEEGPDFPVENHYFGNGAAESLVNISGVGILASSSQQDFAQDFVEFLLSDEGQALFVDGNNEFSVVAGTASPIGLPDPATLNAPSINLAELSDLQTTVELLRRAGALP